MITKIAWKNTWFKPWNTFLSILLLSASVAVISVLLLLQKQLEDQFSDSMQNVDLVLGAKGSPLQLILSAVYHIDHPPGNISYDEAQKWMQNPAVMNAVPLAYGDNYMGFSIVGTDENYFTHFDLKLASGTLFSRDFEVVIGSKLASDAGLKTGDTFYGVHGESEEGEIHDEHAYTVTGILSPSGKVADRLIFCTIPSVWHIHDHEHPEAHDEEDTEHHHDHAEKELTAVLLHMKNSMSKVSWPRMVAEDSDMQAASPAMEINRLFSLLGVGTSVLIYLAYGIMFISGISIFIALFNRLKERKYEFALLRISGISGSRLFGMVLLESFICCITGFITGVLFSRLCLCLISVSAREKFKTGFNPYEFLWKEEGILLLITLAVGVVAALIPAIKAYSLNISKTLADA